MAKGLGLGLGLGLAGSPAFRDNCRLAVADRREQARAVRGVECIVNFVSTDRAGATGEVSPPHRRRIQPLAGAISGPVVWRDKSPPPAELELEPPKTKSRFPISPPLNPPPFIPFDPIRAQKFHSFDFFLIFFLIIE